MSYSSSPPPSGGVNPYGSEPEQPGQPADGAPWQTPASGATPAYGTPPSSGYAVPPPPPPVAPVYQSPETSYGTPPSSYSPYVSTPPGAPGYAGWYTSSRDNGKGTGALIMGILSIVLCFGSLLGIGLGIGAVVMGSQGRRAAAAGTANNGGVATAGFVLGIVGLVLSAFASLGYLANLTQQ